MPKFPKHELVVQANGPIPKSLYEKAAREYAKWWGVSLEASAADASSTDLDEATLRLEEEKGFVREGNVCECESSSTERGIHTIVHGHPELLALLDDMYLDVESNTPMLKGSAVGLRGSVAARSVDGRVDVHGVRVLVVLVVVFLLDLHLVVFEQL